MTTMPTTAPRPSPAVPAAGPAGAVPAPQRRVRIRGVTPEGVMSLLGAASGSLGLMWVLYERVLPASGALGFWLCWYGVFLLCYAAIVWMQWGSRVVGDKLAAVGLSSAGLLVLFVVLDQIGYVVFRGSTALRHLNFFTQTMSKAGPLDPLTQGGIVHALVGSLEQMGIATLFSVPIGILAALFLVEVGGAMARPVRVIVEAMTALPEIIAGLFIYAVVILTLGTRQDGFAAALALTVMMMPVVTRAAEVMIRLVPGSLREASFALGASQWRTVWNVVLPTARSGLATAVVLAMARAVGETAPVLLTAGFTAYDNGNPFSGPQTSLPLYIWNYVRYPQPNMVARAFGAGLALMLMVLLLFAVARLIGGRRPGDLSRRRLRRIARGTAAPRRRPADPPRPDDRPAAGATTTEPGIG